MNPAYYGIQRMGEAGGFNITDSLSKVIFNSMKEENTWHHRGIVMHPLYIELQKANPDLRKGQNITTVDTTKEHITP